ncbi:MAG: tRNA (N6-isopentenyl adenosine(37)-C2)-methylthiotransferase MiaB [Deltaproteobacteria bacterium]|nr:MAG: tRNA (N6-isopentenyl adenosine(37)-C2)-methylthiotransferase MiaB [Deltaproteobacteria bacterium]TNF25056.1 MAG: tRNA (N6-isopentenyl adenosine(37)-C2)-methylthiotransferase MiaB [Deltaproteobacteria bacterium]
MESKMETGLGIRGEGPREQWFTDPESGKKMVQMGDLVFPPRKVWMKTYGCQMNYHDSERLISHLKNLNFSHTENLEEADMVLFNTCAIRDLANQKFYSHLGEMKHLKKKKGEELVIGAGGCIAQTEGKDLVKKYKHLDFAFGTDVIDQINDMVFRTYSGDDKFAVNTWDRSSDFSIETKVSHDSPQAFVNIIKGCNKYCTYCVVPYTRGRERSRKLEEVVNDVKKLVQYQGIQEVTLLGQNVNSYGKENGESLAQLLYELEKIDGLELIRYTTSHPYDVTDDLVQAHGELKKLAKHLHLPVQSGSASVLKRMNREYTPEHFLSLVEKFRKANPEMVISTDIITGFVNETEEEYQMTLDLLTKARFDFIYSYAYSERKGTRAAKMEDFLTDDIRGERLRKLQKHQLEIQAEIRKEMEGKTFRMLVEGSKVFKGEKKWQGRTSCNRIIHFVGKEDMDYKWNWVDVKVTEATALSCQGELLTDYGRRPSAAISVKIQ